MILVIIGLMRTNLGIIIDQLASLAFDLAQLALIHKEVFPLLLEQFGYFYLCEIQRLDGHATLLGSGCLLLDGLHVLDVFNLCVVFLVAQNLLIHELLLLLIQRVSFFELIR